jgi:hypothetical protein
VHLGSDKGGWRISERALDAFLRHRQRPVRKPEDGPE